ncbi:MAG TPA: MFS transporter, partial [Opitutaceae bacterium]
MAHAPRKPAIGFVFVTLCLMMIGYGIIIPVLPVLVTRFEGGEVANGSRYYGILMGSYAAAQFVAAPILGSLSDRFGRRRVLLIALAGSACDYVIMGLAPSMAWLFVARLISGATAGALATCNAYIADVTPPERRAQGFGMVGA